MVLRWGDVRLGNIVFGDDLEPRAILDWDMAAVGVPEHDVAWFTMLDFRDLDLWAAAGRRLPPTAPG
jgi:aminoglycoside phosphotransferase (APT) family kinase protein